MTSASAPNRSTTRELMRAAVLVDAKRLELRDVEVPETRAHEVCVRVGAVGLCGTDLQIFAGHANYNQDATGRLVPLREEPQILGHEIAGTVETVGTAVRDLRPGARVIIDQGRNCVSERRDPPCEYCATGDSHQCERYREHGITGLPGGLAEFITVPAVNAVPIQSALPLDLAALSEPLGCIVHSTDLLTRALARYRLNEGTRGARINTAVVMGAGPAGLLFTQYLRKVLHFRECLIVIEPNAAKRALAERFGAQTIDPSAGDAAAAVQEATRGRRAELLIEATGSAAAFASISRLVRKQATVLLYGHGHAGGDLGVLNQLQFLEPTLLSPAGASGGFEPDGRPTTYVRAVRLIEQGTIDVAPIVTHRYRSLDAVAGALTDGYRAPDYVKGVVTLT
jgi:L-iditol 2-dehydrogenase